MGYVTSEVMAKSLVSCFFDSRCSSEVTVVTRNSKFTVTGFKRASVLAKDVNIKRDEPRAKSRLEFETE